MKKPTEKPRRHYWATATELPQEVFEAWRKPNGEISPVATLATVDRDGSPRIAPFGSVRALSPRVLQLCSLKSHDTYANLCSDGRAMVSLITPPNMTVSARGRARVVRERMHCDENFALLEIDIKEVKNDAGFVIIESDIRAVTHQGRHDWHKAIINELAAIARKE